MQIDRKVLAYRTAAVYLILFVGLSVYFGFYRKQVPGIAIVGIALLLLAIGGLKLWLLSYIGRQLSDERWIERAVDVGLEVLFFGVFVLVFVWLGRMTG
jgi:hypothetical protein